MTIRAVCLLSLMISPGVIYAQEPKKEDVEPTIPFEINTTLMETTFKISGPGKEGTETSGTIFLIANGLSKDSPSGMWVMVTATHVLKEIMGEFAFIELRKELSNGDFVKVPCKIRIRRDGKDLYLSHSQADVSAFNFGMPAWLKPKRAINSNWIATDDQVTKLEIHPGDELFSLGFPLDQEANEMGFPILRSGKIASYPIVPMERRQILYDFNVFGGNSGGPVYFSLINRYGPHPPRQIALVSSRKIDQGLLGIVSDQIESISSGSVQRLGLSVVVPAPFITQVLTQLPGPSQFLECESGN